MLKLHKNRWNPLKEKIKVSDIVQKIVQKMVGRAGLQKKEPDIQLEEKLDNQAGDLPLTSSEEKSDIQADDQPIPQIAPSFGQRWRSILGAIKRNIGGRFFIGLVGGAALVGGLLLKNLYKQRTLRIPTIK